MLKTPILNAALVARDAGLSPVPICADGRLFRAGKAEAIPAFDPEAGTPDDLEQLFGG